MGDGWMGRRPRQAGKPTGVGKEKRGGRESVRRKETNHSDGSVACSL